MRPARARRLAAASVLLTLLAAACTSTTAGKGSDSATPTAGSGRPSGSTAARPSAPATRATFHDCASAFNLKALPFPAGRAKRLSFDCARIQVPLDHADPTGRTISLQLVRVHDSAGSTSSRRSLLVNPGGPGASGVELAVSLAAQLRDAVLSHFDLVGFDPRGVGLSSPITCLTDKQKDDVNAASPNVLTGKGFAAARTIAKRVAAACSRKYGAALADYDTVQTARDMDLVRQAVGDGSMNYLGFSYGTELGAQYARLYPSKVRALVLDGAVDPLADDITSFANQLQGFEDSFDQFAAYCRTTSPCSRLGDPREAVYNLARKADPDGIPSSAAGETRRATSSLVYTGVLQALYSQSLWPTLGSALRTALAGDSREILALADRYNERNDGQYTNISDANNTISCNDARPGPSDATIRATARSWKERFPIFGLWSAPSLFTCQQWQPHRTPPPAPKAATARTVLVVGNLHDPATPYRGAKVLTKTMGNARLLSWDGEGHTSYLQGSSCVDTRVNAYLVSGTLPATGTTCPR
ncbi:alpha/beta hydrolase fold [Jatrophihabitans endophyticus]|uniref:Alpha/beta hydrolase fold n=1 Tax=Jatrophihabitans endophyticus TaxID=1206085 RepID=A0A1M5C9Z2_9ACTN|nr:alpha/beta hydrolase [Jatrophihabitans endophyticus]SHF51545.1 alpha/beta hydrolase fold [Jatrophihabitans endophyticus]